jgi:hypothetical protein
LGIHRDSLRRIEIDQKTGGGNFAGKTGGSAERDNQTKHHGEGSIED